MTYKINITDRAFSDLENIKFFIAIDDPQYISRIFDRLEQIESLLNSGVNISNASLIMQKRDIFLA